MTTRMQQRRGTSTQWTTGNPIMAAGEIGFETDTGKFKVGNGSSAWSALKYFKDADAVMASIIDTAPGTLDTLNEIAAAINNDPQYFTHTAQSIAGSINEHNVSTNIHGITNTALLATLTNVATAKSEAISSSNTTSATALASHETDSTNVHGIADTSALATKTYADGQVGTHAAVTTNVHGIIDTANLATKTYADSAVSTHEADTTNVHGIPNTADLATKTYADSAVSTHEADTTAVHGIADTSLLATKTYADSAVSTHQADQTNVHGIADTSLLATTSYVDTSVGNSVVDQSLLAGVGIDWNVVSEKFDIDSTVATKTYADTAVSTAVTGLTKSSVGLANVDNTSDANKPVSTAAATAIGLKANLASPTFTGTVSGITSTMVGLGNVDNTSDANKPVSTAQSTAIATAKSEAIASATAQVDALLTGAPAALNTLDELAAALGDDANFASTVTTSLGLKAPLASPTFTGTVTVAASGVAFTDGTQTKEGVASRTPIVQKTASYTLSALTERDSLIEMGSSSALTLTIPANSAVAYPVGTSIDILQTSTGQVTIAAGAGVTVNSTPGLKLRTTWSSATLFKRATDTWVVFGDLTA